MKKKLLVLLLMLLIPLSAAYAATTHYGYVTPTVGGSQNTWGSLLNTIFGAIDANIWSASGGTTIGVNASSSASNITLTNPINTVQNITLTTTAKKLILPAMNASSSPVVGGPPFYINNVGSNAFQITANDGSTNVVTALGAGQTVSLQLLTNGTANGTFAVQGPYLTAVGTLALGSSTSGASPSISSDATTGFYTPGAAQVAGTVSGTQRWLLNATGEVITGTDTANAFNMTTTGAAGAGATGMFSPTTNALGWSSTGSEDARLTATGFSIGTTTNTSRLNVAGAMLFTTTGAAPANGIAMPTANTLNFYTNSTQQMQIASDGGVLIGASPTGGSKGAGSINVAGSVYQNGALLATSTAQVFTSSGTWTKPANATVVYISCWGGGAGGGVNACGGGGGGNTTAIFPASSLSSSYSVTIGTGGAGGTGVESGHPPGANGNNTTFGSLLTAFGGACGGGGGQFAQGTQNGAGGAADGGNCNGGNAVYGGGGGGSAGNCTGFGTTNPGGGSSVFGGAGGGGYTGNAQVGGASVNGGNGGSAPACCAAGNAGTAPGGGGGSATNGGGGSLPGGAGARGQCNVYSW